MKARRTHRSIPYEVLENRRLLSSVVVNTIADSTDSPGSGIVSLRDAIAIANASTTATTITFSSSVFASPQTIDLENSLTLINTEKPTSIQGPSAKLTIEDDADGGGFIVKSSVTATLSSFTVTAGENGLSSPSDINNAGSLTLSGLTFTGVNEAATRAADNTGTLNVSGCEIENRGDGNSGITQGGAIYNTGTCNITNSTVQSTDAGGGGAIYQGGGTLQILDSTFNGDFTDDNDGGTLEIAGGSAGLVNSTISGGGVTDDEGGNANGGAIWIGSGGSASLSDVTIDNVYYDNLAGNEVPAAAAIYVSDEGSLTLGNTVIGSLLNQSFDTNRPGIGVTGSVQSLGHNYVEDADTSVGWISSDFLGTTNSPLTPKLGALASNGGPTETELPASGSPLLDHGSNSLVPSGVNTDQRGLARISNSTVDIGAVEIQVAATAKITLTAAAAQSATAGTAKSFSLGSLTETAATSPYSVQVNWGDGSAVTKFTQTAVGNLTAQSHSFATAAKDTVSVTVTDSKSHVSNTATFIVTVSAAPLTGTVIGTGGSYNNDGDTIAKAFDGNLTTFFNGPTASGDWAGLDLGSQTVITSLAYVSHTGFASRMNGGIFQGSNSATFASGNVNLYTVASNANPSSTTFTTQTITNTTAFRYVRYLAPANSYGNVSEIEFFGKAPATLTKFTGTVIGTSGSYQNDGNTIAKAIDGSLTTFFDGPTANGNWVGLDLGTSKAIKQISYAPRSGYASRMVGGEFQVSTTANFSSGVTTIYSITATPVVGSLTMVTLSSPVMARYVRYLSPNGSYGDVSEIAFFG